MLSVRGSMKLVRNFILLLFGVVLFIFVGCVDNNKEDDQLQAKCGKNSEEFFKKSYDAVYSGFYASHYNKKRNKCYMLFYNPVTKRKILYDVNKSNLRGMFSSDGVYCFVYEKKCKTEKEWDELVQPYMEE